MKLHKWETVADNTLRLRVPGGWLYRFREANNLSGSTDGTVDTVALCFVPWHKEEEEAKP